jgi:carboxyl-terminal processing protease
MRRLALLAVAAAVALLPAAAATQGGTGVTRPRTVAEDLQMFSQVLNQIRVNHPDSVDTHRLFMAAIEGMVAAADPHSYVLPAFRLSRDRQEALRRGRLHPVPVAFRYVGGSPVVASVAPGTAAAQQDVLPGDVLVAIDGEPVMAESADELMVFLAGPRNSTVRLRLERQRVDGSLVELERDVRRERVEESTAISAAVMLEPGTGYVRIIGFDNDRVAEDLTAALRTLERQGMERLVLDLRDNGGGLLEEAAVIASHFLPSGAVVYETEGRKPELNETRRVRRSFMRSERRTPMVVLVNDGTASASELVAGALQDHDRALVVGRPTFGKALVMQGFPLTDGSMIMLVVGHLKTPCGRVIQRQYRGIRQRDYYRLSRTERSTAGRPSCRTAGGRQVFGGGGIYPDVLLPEPEPAPLWLSRLREQDLITRWVGAWVTENPAAFTTADALAGAPRLPAAALAEFRAFARQQGHELPDGADADARLQETLVRRAAAMKWGAEGYYLVLARTDSQVMAAVREFTRAEEILRGN